MTRLKFRVLESAILLLAGLVFSWGNLRAEDPLKVTQSEAVKQAVAKPQPDYPPIARQLKLEGKVEVEASITETGSVDSVRILTGNAVLTMAAAAAMKKWRFQPFTEAGKPVRAVATMSFTFKM